MIFINTPTICPYHMASDDRLIPEPLRLILAMESHLGRELPPEAVVEIGSLEDIGRYL